MGRKKLVILIVSLVVLAALAIIWLFAFQKVKITWGDTNNSGSIVVVCGSDLITEYNAAMYYDIRGDSTEPSLDEGGLKSIAGKIKDSAGYESDPTCQAMLFWIAIYNKDYNSAKSAHEAVKVLHEKRIYADSNIRSNAPLFEYDSALRDISPALDTDGGAGDDD